MTLKSKLASWKKFDRSVIAGLSPVTPEALEVLMKAVMRGTKILTAGEIHDDIPTIHSIGGKYRRSVKHLGFGCFEGETPHGKFTFDGGGAMTRSHGTAWTYLSADDAVTRDLGYDIRKVKKALEELGG